MQDWAIRYCRLYVRWKGGLFSWLAVILLVSTVAHAQDLQPNPSATASDATQSSTALKRSDETTPPLNGHKEHGWERTLNEEFNGNRLSRSGRLPIPAMFTH
jgi:hypothetical protein